MIEVRELAKEDMLIHGESLFSTYTALVPSSGENIHELLSIYQKMKDQGTVVLIAFDDELNKIIGVMSVLIELKLIRGGVVCGHLEDIAVSPSAQGKGIGRKLITKALEIAKDKGCYKVILDCDASLSGYYAKFGFEDNGTFMRKYL